MKNHQLLVSDTFTCTMTFVQIWYIQINFAAFKSAVKPGSRYTAKTIIRSCMRALQRWLMCEKTKYRIVAQVSFNTVKIPKWKEKIQNTENQKYFQNWINNSSCGPHFQSTAEIMVPISCTVVAVQTLLKQYQVIFGWSCFIFIHRSTFAHSYTIVSPLSARFPRAN